MSSQSAGLQNQLREMKAETVASLEKGTEVLAGLCLCFDAALVSVSEKFPDES